MDNLFLFYTIIKNVEIRIRGRSQPPRGVGSQLISDFFLVYRSVLQQIILKSKVGYPTYIQGTMTASKDATWITS